MRCSTTRILTASIAVLFVCWMLQRVIGILGSSPLVGKLHSTYFRNFGSGSGMSRHTIFKDGEGVFNHGAFTVQAIPTLEDNYAYVSLSFTTHSRPLNVTVVMLVTRRRLLIVFCVMSPLSSACVLQLLVDTASKSAALIDPAEPELAIDALKRHSDLKLTHVLTTHKHWDHAQGNTAIKQQYPNVQVVGGEIDKVTAATHNVKHNDKLTIGQNTHVTVYHTPCHTRGHVLYHVTSDSGSGVLFTGDTLFIAGCGKFFEGTASEMHHNLNTVIAKLPADTTAYVGHEYTQSNLEFAAWAEPSNTAVKEKLAWARSRREGKQTTLATTVGEEKAINPFMRVGEVEIVERVKRWMDKNVDGDDGVRVMAALREAKNQNAHKQSANL